MSEYDRLMRAEREGTSARFPARTVLSVGEPTVRITEEPKVRITEDKPMTEDEIFSMLRDERAEDAEVQKLVDDMRKREIAQRIQDRGEQLSYAGLAPTLSGQATGFFGDLLYAGGAGARYMMGEEGAGTEAAMGVAAAALPLIPIGLLAKSAKVLGKYPESKVTKETRDLYRQYQSRVAAGELTGEQAAKELAPKMEEAAKYLAATNKPKAKNPLEDLIPGDALETLQAYPDTKAANLARSVMRQHVNLVKMGKMTPEQARKSLEAPMKSYAQHAERQAGDVMGQARSEAAYATRTKKRSKISDDPRASFEGEDRALKMVQKEADEATSVSQPLEYEKTYFSRDAEGKITRARKLRPGARLDLEKRRAAYRRLPAKVRAETPEPKLTDEDFYDVGTAPKPYLEGARGQAAEPLRGPEYAHQRKIREYEELQQQKGQLAEASFDPLEAAIRRAGYQTEDRAAREALKAARRRALIGEPNWNDSELAFIRANQETNLTKGLPENDDQVKEFLLDMRENNKRVVLNDEGGFDILDESSLITAEDLPDVDPDFLLSLKQGKREASGPVRKGRKPKPTEKVDRDSLRARRRAQISESKPKDARTMTQRARDLEKSPDFDLDAQEAFERGVREEQAAARGGFVGDRADYLDQVEAAKDQASRDRQFFEDEMFEQAKRDSYPTMSEREVLENLDEVKRTFKGDPDAMKEIARIEREARRGDLSDLDAVKAEFSIEDMDTFKQIRRVERDAAKQSALSKEEYLYENLPGKVLDALVKRSDGESVGSLTKSTKAAKTIQQADPGKYKKFVEDSRMRLSAAKGKQAEYELLDDLENELNAMIRSDPQADALTNNNLSGVLESIAKRRAEMPKRPVKRGGVYYDPKSDLKYPDESGLFPGGKEYPVFFPKDSRGKVSGPSNLSPGDKFVTTYSDGRPAIGVMNKKGTIELYAPDGQDAVRVSKAIKMSGTTKT
jgi:polyhydroxyalkanoate synthesis regulator phasin|tara:strand:- start:4493 stop:7381 length:2889 start_codon:yes stop_codon:yes gene_type:complete